MHEHSPAKTVYLDFAATAAVRPPAVIRAVTEFLQAVGATPGRGGHRLAVEAGRTALHCRQLLARLLGIPGDAGRIAFMFNATHALNTALYGVLQRGHALVVTSFDHNAVLRPAHQLARERGVEVRLVAGDSAGALDREALAGALRGARLVSINAASNVLGSAVDVKALCAMARDAGALTLIDLAQLAGHVPFDVAACGADLVAFTGHKGLLGPHGTGGLWVREGVDVAPLLTGGTGGESESREMPRAYPDHLEAGTQNGSGIAGLAAGVEWLLEYGVANLHARLSSLKLQFRNGLESIAGVRIISPAAPEGMPIVTVTCDDLDAATVAARLEREHGIMTRAGLHCAPEAHRVVGTLRSGAVRFSLGWSSTEEDVERALAALASLVDVGRFFASGVAPAGRAARAADGAASRRQP